MQVDGFLAVLRGFSLLSSGTHYLVVVVCRVSIDCVAEDGPYDGVGLVDMVYQHAAARQVGIPPEGVFLAVLEEEELVVDGRIDAIARQAEGQGSEGVAACLADDFRLVDEAHGVALVEGVTCRGAVSVEVAAFRHDRPAAGVVALPTAFLIVGVVEVVQSQHMAELVADGADAVELGWVEGALNAI